MGTHFFPVMGSGNHEHYWWIVGLVCFVAAVAYGTAVRRPPVVNGNRRAMVRVGKIFEAHYYEESTKRTQKRKPKAKGAEKENPTG